MRIGTRGSALALAQAGHVAELFDEAELVTITTSGDRTEQDATPGEAPADKSRWVDAIEAALLAGEIDLAVHSAKDVPGELTSGLSLLGAPARVSAEDVLCGAPGLDALSKGARVGTGSLRRAAQLRAVREDLQVIPIGGNVDTRLRRLGERRGGEHGESERGGARRGRGDRDEVRPGEKTGGAESEDGLDAIVLAHAGLLRLGRETDLGAVLDPARFVPAPGQGVLALEGRGGDSAVVKAVQAITDADAFACLRAERAVANALDASCHTPLGAHAVPAGCGCLNLRAWVGLPDGSAWVSDELLGGFYDPDALGERVAERMLAVGARELLQRAEEMAAQDAQTVC